MKGVKGMKDMTWGMTYGTAPTAREKPVASREDEREDVFGWAPLRKELLHTN